MTKEEIITLALEALTCTGRIVDLQTHIENFDGEDR